METVYLDLIGGISVLPKTQICTIWKSGLYKSAVKQVAPLLQAATVQVVQLARPLSSDAAKDKDGDSTRSTL